MLRNSGGKANIKNYRTLLKPVKGLPKWPVRKSLPFYTSDDKYRYEMLRGNVGKAEIGRWWLLIVCVNSWFAISLHKIVSLHVTVEQKKRCQIKCSVITILAHSKNAVADVKQRPFACIKRFMSLVPDCQFMTQILDESFKMQLIYDRKSRDPCVS